MSMSMNSGQATNNDGQSSAPAPAPASDQGNAGRTIRTSIHSFHSTTRIIHSGSSLSIHSASTRSSVDIVSAGPPDEDILSIQASIEQVAATQSNPFATRTRAGFNSISDALGNLRSRLHQAHHERQRSSPNRSSWIHRLQERLHILDAAHSSRTPLQVMETRQRRRSATNNVMMDQAEVQGIGGNEEDAAVVGVQSLPPLCVSATIFHIDINPTTPRVENASADRRDSESQPTLQYRRTSVLFASRTVANRSITNGTSSLLLASGGDRATTSRHDLFGDRILRSPGSLRDFETHVHPSVSRVLSPIADSDACSSRSEATSTSMEEDEDQMDVELMEDGVVDIRNKLYSWGWGEQSCHDDPVDRILSMERDETKTAEQMEVSSRLQSKSIVAVATGHNHSACATSQGGLYIVGKNVNGCVDPNLQEGSVISRPVLLDCISHIKVLQVSCGYDHTAVLASNGFVVSHCFPHFTSINFTSV